MNHKAHKNIGLFPKFFKKNCRILAKVVFPNSLRILFLKAAGVKIYDNVTINEGFTFVGDVGYESELKIEDRVAIGPNVTMIVKSHPNNSKLIFLKDNCPFVNVSGKILIRHDAWIGAGCIILPNICIGEFSIVGAGSVVTRDVLPYTIVAGVPAKVLKNIPRTIGK
jgi:acetyltransferase-like isoleucine patch superfamily enzyme